MSCIHDIYERLLSDYGPQGWWPLLDVKGTNPTKSGSTRGYHPSDYSYPKNRKQVFEICIGAILTQNTAWPNVEKALLKLKQANAINPTILLSMNEENIKKLIRPAGYYNQKTRKLKEFSLFFHSLNGNTPTRDDLLSIWGIGPETADSILLYAFNQPEFVIDSYTKRIFKHLDLLTGKEKYDEIKALFESDLPKDPRIYQEYHALIVEHAKIYYQKKPYKDPITTSRSS